MLISVIIPVYKVEKTLERAVNSVLDQSYPHLEIILVDDGSPDKSGDIADQLAKKDPRIQVIHQANKGLSGARNTGIAVASGDYLAFLDSDDCYELDLFEHFMASYQEEGPDLFIFNVKRIGVKSQTVKDSKEMLLTSSQAGIEAMLDYSGIDFYAWNKVYARQLFRDVRFPEGKLYEDTAVSYATMKRATRIMMTSYVGINYYENEESIVAQSFNPKQMDNVTERARMLDDVQVNFPDLTAKAGARLFDGLLSTAYKMAQVSPFKQAGSSYRDLLEIVNHYRPYFEGNEEIDWKKRFAWQLFRLNPKLYARMYQWYLGK